MEPNVAFSSSSEYPPFFILPASLGEGRNWSCSPRTQALILSLSCLTSLVKLILASAKQSLEHLPWQSQDERKWGGCRTRVHLLMVPYPIRNKHLTHGPRDQDTGKPGHQHCPPHLIKAQGKVIAVEDRPGVCQGPWVRREAFRSLKPEFGLMWRDSLTTQASKVREVPDICAWTLHVASKSP